MNATPSTLKNNKRSFLPDDFSITDWAKLKPWFQELQQRALPSIQALEQWIADLNELIAVVDEDFAWRYIRMSVNTEDRQAAELYQYAVQQLMPHISRSVNELHKKLVAHPLASQLDPAAYGIYFRQVQNELSLYREENIPLQTDEQMKARTYGQIFGRMTVTIDGKTLTLQQAGKLLQHPDRAKREATYRAIQARIGQDEAQLDALFDELVAIRHQQARNAGFDNYRDYKHKALGRLDYTSEDCLAFHEAIARHVRPLVAWLHETRRKNLGLSSLRPWDLAVDPYGKAPLRPFEHVDELVEKSVRVLSRLHPFFGESLRKMQKMGHLDLDSRPSKRPGGYNMPLYVTGVPFIFMNAVGTMSDLRTLMHEAGHAVHSFLTRHYHLVASKELPSEVAELASMTMELFTMDYWDEFFDDEVALLRARRDQLESVISGLPWIATIDKFQHWVYTHPTHTHAARRTAWLEIFHEFSSPVVDRSGLEESTARLWHRQLHIFEVPFYYIEYGMAQLGALAIWKNYRENPKHTVAQYIEALKLGYTRPIPEVYAAAGIRFDFSDRYVAELMQFVREELEQLICP